MEILDNCRDTSLDFPKLLWTTASGSHRLSETSDMTSRVHGFQLARYQVEVRDTNQEGTRRMHRISGVTTALHREMAPLANSESRALPTPSDIRFKTRSAMQGSRTTRHDGSVHSVTRSRFQRRLANLTQISGTIGRACTQPCPYFVCSLKRENSFPPTLAVCLGVLDNDRDKLWQVPSGISQYTT